MKYKINEDNVFKGELIIILINFCLVIFLFNPIVVKANIVCNDGTTSPSCSTCHQGCCSRHGGCSSSSSSSSSYKKPTVTPVVKSSDVSLKKVTIDGEDITIMNNMTYVTNKDSVTILAVANDSKAILDYKKDLNLIIGENVISIKVTAENGSIKNYKLSITREKILSDNKNIKIFVMDKEIKFHSYKSDTFNISNNVEKLDITYELEDNNAHAEIIGNDNLQVGHNEIIVRVTSENGEAQDYRLIVEKEDVKKENAEWQGENQTQDDTQNVSEDTSIPYILLGTATLGGLSYFIYKKVKKK